MNQQAREAFGRFRIGNRWRYVVVVIAALLASVYSLYMGWLVIHDRMPQGMLLRIVRFSGWWTIGEVDLLVGAGFLGMTFGLAWMANRAWRCWRPQRRRDAPLTRRLIVSR